MILNSQQIEQLVSIFGIQKSEHTILPKLSLDLADTLAAYAEVVQKVAEANEWCGWQGVSGLVLDEEAWLKARKLRGLV